MRKNLIKEAKIAFTSFNLNSRDYYLDYELPYMECQINSTIYLNIDLMKEVGLPQKEINNYIDKAVIEICKGIGYEVSALKQLQKKGAA